MFFWPLVTSNLNFWKNFPFRFFFHQRTYEKTNKLKQNKKTQAIWSKSWRKWIWKSVMNENCFFLYSWRKKSDKQNEKNQNEWMMMMVVVIFDCDACHGCYERNDMWSTTTTNIHVYTKQQQQQQNAHKTIRISGG